MKILAIIPTYNEKDNIEKLIRQILGLNFNSDPKESSTTLDILIIDDNSPDGTGKILNKLKMNPVFNTGERLKVIHREGKLGLGSAYIMGFRWALENGYDVVFTMDADFSHNPQYLPKFLQKLSGYDLIVGSRYVKGGGTVGWPLRRKFISRCGNFYAKIITGMPVNDCTSGFMCIKKNVLESIDVNQIKTEGYGFLIEVKFRAFKKGFKLCEIPILFEDRVAGKSKISRNIIFEAMFLVWKLRFYQ